MHFVLVYKWQLLSDWLIDGVLSREMASLACGLMNGDFCLWFDWWRFLPMVWLMAISVCGLMNGDFCLWFDWWRLLPMVWLMAISVCGLMNGDFCLWFDWWHLLPPVVWLMASFACSFTKWQLLPEWLIDGFLIDVFYPEKWRLLPMVRLTMTPICGLTDVFYPLEMTTSARFLIGGLYPPRNDYCTINWDVILGRIPISGLFTRSYPRQRFNYWVDPPSVVELMGVIPSVVELMVCFPFKWSDYGTIPL